jgi:hypothetical protein
MPTWKPGKYKIINGDGVNIRHEPKVVQWIDPKTKEEKSNKVGQYKFGDIVEIFGFDTDGVQQTWGRVSQEDAAGKSQWICVRSINRTMAAPLEEAEQVLSDHERLEKMEAFLAVRLGYRP